MFEHWLKKYDRMIHHLLHQYHIHYDRDDYYQLALIRLWHISEHYDAAKTTNESQYVYAQLKFCLIDEIRRRMKYQDRYQLMANDEVPEVLTEESSPLCLFALTADEKEWFRLTEQGYNLTEIAHLMQRTYAQMKYIRKKAQHKLQENNDLPFKYQG